MFDPIHPTSIPAPELTDRERETLRLIALGETDKGIGRQLGIGARTAKTHRAALIDKFGARNAPHLIRLARYVLDTMLG